MGENNQLVPAITAVGTVAVACGVCYVYYSNLSVDKKRPRRVENVHDKVKAQFSTENPSLQAKSETTTPLQSAKDSGEEMEIVENMESRDERQRSVIKGKATVFVQLPKEETQEKRIIYRRTRKQVATPERRYPFKIHDSSLLKDVLTEELYNSMATKVSAFGFTLNECIQPGVQNPDGNPNDRSGRKCCGAVAGDADCYKVFRPLFHSLALKRHPKYAAEPELRGRQCDLAEFPKLKLPAFEPIDVVRLDIELHRNLKSHKFPSSADRKCRRVVRDILLQALAKCCDKHPSVVYDLSNLKEADRFRLQQARLLPEPPSSPYEVSAGLRHDWPDGRAVWICDELNIAAFINVVDHLVVIATEVKTGRLDELGERVAKFHDRLNSVLAEKNEDFASDDSCNFGYLTTFPELLGPAVVFRADVRRSQWLGHDQELQLEHQLRDNVGFILRHVEDDEEFGGSLITVETRLCLGYHDYKLVEMFEGGVKRILKLNREAGQ